MSVHTVRARVSRPMHHLVLEAPGDTALASGDLVFLTTDAGLEHIGEVTDVSTGRIRATLAVEPPAFQRLTASTRATCWRTPLSAEEMVPALLPSTIQQKVAERIAADWYEHEEEVASTWAPLVRELASAYLEAISDDVEASFQRHQDELWTITKSHGRAIAAEWPAIQERLGPILQQHLTPVLARLMHEAIAEAPKVAIAWNIARGKNDEAFRCMLDWLADYLATMSDEDKAEFAEAVDRTWQTAREDEILVSRLTEMGRGILEDRNLRDVLTQIYREAVADNPQTPEFLRSEVLGSERMREQMYAFIEAFAPTARNVLAICLFDETGRTRSEVAHLVRSAALGRSVAWVTLEPGDSGQGLLEPGSTLSADLRGDRP
jgi:hypothetical protein